MTRNMILRHSPVLTLLLLTVVPESTASEPNPPSWNQFRGPNGSGVVNSCRPPMKIDADQPAWISSVPSAKSSPVVWKKRVFLVGVEDGRLLTLALESQSGDTLWRKPAPEVPLARVHTFNTPAASTPCVDEERLFVYFGSYGLLCYDHDGREQWKTPIPPPKNMYGMSTSPIRHRNLLLLVLDDDANMPGSRLSRSKVIALNNATGEVVWKTPRPYNRSGWSTPIIWEHEKGTDLAVLGNGRAYGYDPVTGQEKWYVNGFSRETISSPVAGNGHLYVSASMQGGIGDEKFDPEPFWVAMLQFDKNGDERLEPEEMTEHFTTPFRPELPPGHPGFGMPLSRDPATRRRQQEGIFKWRDKNKDGFWTREEFLRDLSFKRVLPNLAAIRPGGEGDITDTHVSWNLRRGIPEIPSPVCHRDRLYIVRDGGILSCVDAETGDIIYRKRTGALGQYTASPIIARDHLYLASTRGVVTVVKTGDDFEVVHQEDLELPVFATPAIDENSLYIRTENGLMAFRE